MEEKNWCRICLQEEDILLNGKKYIIAYLYQFFVYCYN